MDNPRRVIYPYTFTAKLAMFPYKYYWNNSWAFKYYLISVGVCLPFFYKIQKALNSPQNVAKFEEKKKKDHEDHLKHLQHLK